MALRQQHFSVVDFCIFGGMLLFSLLIGIYYAIRRNKTTKDLLLGGGEMSVFPVAISMCASFLSAISLLGIPAETYKNGIAFWLYGMFIILPMLLNCVLILPIFYNHGVTSVYEYIQDRFRYTPLRTLCCVLNLVQITFYMAMAMYAPCLAIVATTSFPLWASLLSMAVVASICTGFGGMLAVVWTDVLQYGVMMAGMVVICVQGASEVGGMEEAFRINQENRRLELFDFSFDPWQRHNFWNLLASGLVSNLSSIGVSQTAVQRYRSLPTLRKAQITCLLQFPISKVLLTMSALTGLLVFSTYAHCDPLDLGIIDKKDQLVPYFVLDKLSYLPGVGGLIVATLMSGALSSLSSGLSSLSAITWQDLLSRVHFFSSMTPSRQTLTTKLMGVIYGMIALGLAFLASHMGGILQATITVLGALNGPNLGVFLLAIFVPFSQAKGCLVGLVFGTAMASWIALGQYLSGSAEPEYLPTYTDGCDDNVTSLIQQWSGNISVVSTLQPEMPVEKSFLEIYLYGLSYTLVSVIGCVTTMVVGTIASLIQGPTGSVFPQELVNPTVLRLYRWAGGKQRFCAQQDILDMDTNNAGIDNPAFTKLALEKLN